MPPVFLSGYRRVSEWCKEFKFRAQLRKNKDIHGRHSGERCFILCNGPSVNGQKLNGLKDEIVISVSNGYRHNFYAEIAPKYHLIPHFTFGSFTIEDALVWLGEMDERLKCEIVFVSTQQMQLVESEKKLGKQNVRYFFDQGDFTKYETIPEFTRCIPGAKSAPILAIMLAMYMGFENIYLIGVDHDWFIKKNYRYAFGVTSFDGKDAGVDAGGAMPNMRLADELPNASALWLQYRALNRIAKANKIQIYNATLGGALDEFERVDINSIIGVEKNVDS